MDCEFLIDGKAHKISIEHKDGKTVAILNGERLELDAQRISAQAVSLLINGKSCRALVARDKKKIFVAVGSHHFCLEEPDQGTDLASIRGSAPGEVQGTIKAPMPGLVIKVNVVDGSKVNAGDGLVVVEAMKMEHEMRAAFNAIVEKVYVKAGQQVDALQPLVELRLVEK